MPANVEGMVREGVNAYRAGRKDEARALLLRAVEIDQYNEQAWLWLSAVVDSVDEQRTCLENVLTINPNNGRAKQGLDMLAKQGSSSAPAPAASGPSDEDVLASSVFSQTGEEELPPSIDWNDAPAAPVTATSSASTYYQVEEPSAQEYDSWVANLGLGTNSDPEPNPSATLPPTPAAFSTAFVDDDEDLFGAESSIFDMDSPAPEKTDTPPPPRPASKASTGSITSPPPKEVSPDKDSLLDAIDDDDDDLLVSEFDQSYDDAELERLDPSEFFRYIPKEIKATRLPGTREGFPILVLLGLIVLLVLNVGAVIFLVSQLSATAG